MWVVVTRSHDNLLFSLSGLEAVQAGDRSRRDTKKINTGVVQRENHQDIGPSRLSLTLRRKAGDVLRHFCHSQRTSQPAASKLKLFTFLHAQRLLSTLCYFVCASSAVSAVQNVSVLCQLAQTCFYRAQQHVRRMASQNLKRPASERDASDNVSKRSRVMNDSTHLTSWLSSPTLQVPNLIAASREVVEQDSVFLAHAASVSTPAQADIFRRHVRDTHKDDEASHEMLGWRVLVPKPGKDGTGSGDDWTLKVSSDDDGEKYGGTRILNVLEARKAVDVAVVVSRWFGGTMIGPARFRHIEECTKSALDNLSALEQETALLGELQGLDNTIVSLCRKLSEKGQHASPGKKADYADASVEKMQRLVGARSKRVELLQAQLRRLESESVAAPAAGVSDAEGHAEEAS